MLEVLDFTRLYNTAFVFFENDVFGLYISKQKVLFMDSSFNNLG
jgi:hypothetical protein